MPCCSLEGARSWRRTHGAAVKLGDGRASAVPGLLLSRRGRGAGSAHTGLLSCCRHAAVAAAGCLLVQPRSWARRGLAADPSLLLGVASKGRRPLLRVCTSLAAGALVAGPLLIAAWWREVKGGAVLLAAASGEERRLLPCALDVGGDWPSGGVPGCRLVAADGERREYGWWEEMIGLGI